MYLFIRQDPNQKKRGRSNRQRAIAKTKERRRQNRMHGKKLGMSLRKSRRRKK